MIIGIVVPLVAKSVSKCWQTDCELVEATTKSILQQSNPSFRCIVVGHDCPEQLEGKQHAGNDIFLAFSDLEPPVVGENNAEAQLKYEVDRCSKTLKGIMHLKKTQPDITHWFAVDSDDLIHRDFVKTLVEGPEKDAYLIKNGYFYYKNNNIFTLTDEFYSYCGSSSIISDKYFQLPNDITETAYKGIPFGAVSHVNIGRYLEKRGVEYHVPDKRLLMYVRDSGTNISDYYIKGIVGRVKTKLSMFLKMKSLNKKEREAFAITS